MPLHRSHLHRSVLRLTAATALAAGTLLGVSTTAQANETSITDATLAWSLSDEQGGGAFFGGCNFLSAGTAGNTGSSRLWTESDGFYKTTDGNVTVEKPNAAGVYTQPTWSTKCQGENGAPVTSATLASTHNRVRLSAGTGSFDPATGAGTITWKGSFTSAFYGGLTYWSAADPVLTVEADGTAMLTARVSGYGADMDDSEKWDALTPRDVTLADLSDVHLSEDGVTATPQYLGVEVETGSGTAQKRDGATWGSFPQSFVDFQAATGQSSYWYSSGGQRDAAKPATPLHVSLTPAADSTVSATAQKLTYGKGGSLPVTVTSPGSTPTGTVRLTGLGTPSSATLVNGRATFAIAKTTAVKTYRATISYLGSADVAASTRDVTVTVAKAVTGKPTVKVTALPTSKKAGKATVTVKSTVSGLTPSGTVRVTLTKGKTKKTVASKLSQGKKTLTLPKLTKGTWRLTVAYLGSSTQSSSTSKTYTVASKK